jgi:hypothetical protein
MSLWRQFILFPLVFSSTVFFADMITSLLILGWLVIGFVCGCLIIFLSNHCDIYRIKRWELGFIFLFTLFGVGSIIGVIMSLFALDGGNEPLFKRKK